MTYRVIRSYQLERIADDNGEYEIADNRSYTADDFREFNDERDAQNYAHAHRDQSCGVFTPHRSIPGRWIYLYDASEIQR